MNQQVRVILKRKKIIQRKESRELEPDARLLVAKDIMNGKPMKRVAGDWGISISQAYKIFYEHLRYKVVWKGKRPLC
jgi:hypothetical protein